MANRTPSLSFSDRLILFVAEGFGSGRSPLVPGTAGSLLAAALVLGLSRSPLPAHLTLAALALTTTAVSWAIGGRVERLLGEEDPSSFVLDEFAGLFVACLTLSEVWPRPSEVMVSFLLFRLFDVAKPTPARQLQNLGGGAGIVLDDVAAGFYALLGVTVYRHVAAGSP